VTIMSRVTSTEIRPDPALYPMVFEPRARYSDLDPSRRIGREALVRWFEDARVAVELDAIGTDLADRQRARVGQLLVSVQVDVIAPLRIAGRYRVGIGVSHIGTKSLSYSYGVFAGDDLVATGESTSVYTEGGVPTAIPPVLREALGKLELPVEGGGRIQPESSRLVRENYPFRYDVRTRFGDLDTNRHVNNVALAGWYLDGLAELHTDVLGYPVGGPLDGLEPSSLRVEYLDEVRFPGIYQLRVGLVDIDDTHARYACGLFDGSRCIGLAEAVGEHTTRGADGDQVDLGAKLQPFRMKG
jgi:acyl-CoA thioester hydrolase